MSILRSKKDRENPYVQINRKMFDDPNLSMKTKGFIGYCLSKPDDWKFYIEQLTSVLKEKKTAIYTAIQEAEEQGYCIKFQHRLEKGRMGKFEYIISDSKEEIAKLKEELNITTKAKPVEKKQEFKKCLPLSGFPLADNPLPENQPLTINNDKEDLYKENDINVMDDRSSFISESIVSFHPDTYVLPDGKHLSLHMRRSIAKYSEEDLYKLRSNIAYFEEQVKKGIKPKESYEKWLQACIKYNYAAKQNNQDQNKLYARFVKEEYKIRGLKILKTVVQFKRSEREIPESLSLNLPPESFSAALEKFIENNRG